MSSAKDYEAWKRENEKLRVLNTIDMKGTLDVSQISDILHRTIKEIETIVTQLTDEKLVKSDVGNYYHLTFEGERYLRFVRERAQEKARFLTKTREEEK